MGAYQCWTTQCERLRETLAAAGDAAGAAYLVRHALSQVEQNTMAEQPDDLLRQQTGILFACVKTSLNLLDISLTSKVWVAQTAAGKPKGGIWRWLLLAAFTLAAGIGAFAYVRGQWLLFAAAATAAVLGTAGWLLQRRAAKQTGIFDEDRLKVTTKPDTEQLFQAVETQMRAIDRYINDFAYLNEQSALSHSVPDAQSISVLADLMQAVYETDGEAGEDAAAAAEHLLASLGVRAAGYTPQDARLFTVLPSISETRTLSPALLATKDGALLRRGTAAVMQGSDAEGGQALPPRSQA